MKRLKERLTIEAPPEYHFAAQLDMLQKYPADLLFRIEGRRLLRALRTEGGPVLLDICGEAGEVRVEMQPAVKPEQEWEVRRYVTEWLDLDADIRPFYALAEQDRLLGPLVKRYRGLYRIGIPDLFEALAWSVIGQQINLPFAYTLKRRLITTFGKYAGGDCWLFPAPEIIAGLTPDELLPLQFSRRKAEYLIAIAAATVSGTLTKELLAALPDIAERKAYLCSFRGIGEWTADYVLLKSLREATAFPAGDAGLQNAVKAELALPAKPMADDLRHLAENWQGCEAYAVIYLWRTLFSG